MRIHLWRLVLLLVVILLVGKTASANEAPGLSSFFVLETVQGDHVLLLYAIDQVNDIHLLERMTENGKVDGNLAFSDRTGQTFLVDWMSRRFALKDHTLQTQALIKDRVLNYMRPLSGPRDVQFFPYTSGGDAIVTMSGEQSPFTNLYLVPAAGPPVQLTDIENLVDLPLTASAEFISWRPSHPDQFLFRARARDVSGFEINALYIFDLSTFEAIEAPFFGQSPAWSPDGIKLVGTRLRQTEIPLYELWVVNLLTNESTLLSPGCNPTWSPDGEWIAYDGHTESQWQGYTDCFTNGQVHIMRLDKLVEINIEPDATGSLQIIDWADNISQVGAS